MFRKAELAYRVYLIGQCHDVIHARGKCAEREIDEPGYTDISVGLHLLTVDTNIYLHKVQT